MGGNTPQQFSTLQNSSYQEQRSVLIAYLKSKLIQEDWYAVRDCCVDIEVLDAKHNRS